MRRAIYLDNHATTPVDPRVIEGMLPFFTDTFGNPASSHEFGRVAAQAVEHAREQVANLIHAEPREVVFTSGATESNNLAIKGAAGAQPEKRHIISSPTEHHAVLDVLYTLQSQGYEIEFVSVDRDGLVDVEGLQRLIRRDTLLVSIMGANNEIGTLAEVEKIGAITRDAGVLFHCDAVQLAGTVAIDVKAMNADLVSISGHKMYAPKGIGALYVRHRTPVTPMFDGGGHERGLRSGTVNVPGCVGIGLSSELAANEPARHAAYVQGLRDVLYSRLCFRLGEHLVVNGHPERRLPGNLNVRFPGVDADSLILMTPNVAMSSGSACSSASPEPSYVLRAIGMSYGDASECVRFGIGRFNTHDDIEQAAEAVADAVAYARGAAGVT